MARGNAKTAKLYNADTVNFAFPIGLKDAIAKFAQDVKEEAVRPAVFAGVTVLYDEMRLRVPLDTGQLKNSIYRWRVKQDIGEKVTFYVGVNKRKAPHWWLVEFGHWQYYQVLKLPSGDFVTLKNRPLATPKFIPAKPYIRPTIDAKLSLAVTTSFQVLKQRIKTLGNNKTNSTASSQYEYY